MQGDYAGHSYFKLLQVVSHSNDGRFIHHMFRKKNRCYHDRLYSVCMCVIFFELYVLFSFLQVWEFPSSVLFIIDIFVLSSNAVALRGLDLKLLSFKNMKN